MKGVVLVDKPEGITSFDAVHRMRRLYQQKQVGHTGTLDPMATGLLPICIGRATKIADYVADNRKAYVAHAIKGIRTDTFDASGVVFARSKQKIPENIEPVLDRFRGVQIQLPPMHSALKYKGRKLYEYARQGICVPRKERPITVSSLELLERDDDGLSLKAEVSSGTYIRTLIDDIGVAMGCYLTMDSLRRISVGDESVEDAYTLEEIESMSEKDRQDILIPMDRLLDHVPAIHLPHHRKKPMLNGMSTRIHFQVEEAPLYRIYTGEDFIGIGILVSNGEEKELRIKKVLY